MALHHAEQGEPIDVRPYGAAIQQAQSVALFKSQGLEVIRLVLPAGHTMPAHKVTGEITIQCLEGVVDVDVAGAATLLTAGHLLYVQGGVEHALTARQAASVLVTIAL
ncbi:MAG: cupin domain-containing protein [Pseudomonadota bacterium]|nr:cupin domain-containing protein [Pseudomonadota bacterium]